MVKEY